MKHWRQAAAGILAAVLCLSLLSGCGSENEDPGLSLSVCLGGPPVTLDPIRATEAQDMTVLTHLYENLMRIAPDSTGGTAVANGMAKSYDTDENSDGSVTYTFHLRSAKWSDGKEVTAQDFVYAWQRLANPASQAPNAQLLSVVKGFDQVQSTGDVSLLEVEAKNDSTFLVTLTGDCSWFLNDVCTAPATSPLREDVVQRLKTAALEANQQALADGGTATATWCSDYTKLVTNGPYEVESYNRDSLALRKNARYTGVAGTGPSGITLRYAETAEDAWALYQDGTVDFVSPLSREALEQAAESETWTAIPELDTYTLLFNTAADPFSDPAACKAFALSLDRTVLSGTAGVETWPATGLVPYGVPESEDSDFRTAGGELVSCDPEGYAENCAQAQALLDEAGYGAGYPFPETECLYVDQGQHRQVVTAMVSMWSQVLGVRITPKAVTEEELEAALLAGDYVLAAADIRGYANDAESFLTSWKSESPKNVVGYRNSAFDTLLTVIAGANNNTARRGCLHDAESLLLEDCPLTPLYFTGTDYELRQGLTGVCRDARGFFSFATTVELP